MRYRGNDGVCQQVTVHGLICRSSYIFCAPHQKLEFAFFLVIDKQFFCQHRLVIQHIDKETQSPKAVADAVKGPSRPHLGLVNFGHQHLFNAIFHARNRLGGLVQPEERKHAAHLRQLPGHYTKRRLVLGTAKEQIQ